MNKNCSIGVFDSGVGGVTVLKVMRELLPKENIIYYADSGNAPYGKKSIEELQKLCFNIIDFFIKNNCKAIVIACNTATAAAFSAIKDRYSMPVIGVIAPGAKAAVRSSINRNIAVLSTVFTANSGVYADEIKKVCKKAVVYQEGCPELCTMIETGWESFPNRLEILEEHISKFPKDVDTLVLGCTHYPIIEKDIRSLFKGNIIVDPAKETVYELIDTLKAYDLVNNSNKKGDVEFFVSGDRRSFKNIAEKFLNCDLTKVYQVEK